ncbi:MAG: (4Fe-4S)-binding protein [Actinomycetota bacterium]|nr:(4Fe-4S)-binding protein [Actinomycetota bacterium]MDQ2958040.1 (4Fe-4S)-binding protein [Actinomycetota bacterium]
MPAAVDAGLCLGTGLCEAMGPTLFRLSPDGLAAPLLPAAEPHSTERLREIAECCPTGAITVIEPGP